jgi:phosphonate transport system substrate-binding protein
MMQFWKQMLFCFFFISVFSAVTVQGASELTLGVIPFKTPRVVRNLYLPLASYLSDALGVNVRILTARSYEEYMEHVYARQYDIIALGSGFYFKAHDKAGYQAIARGYPPFHSGIIVLKNSGITHLEQLKGKSMAAVNKTGRGGYKLQKRALLKKGVDPEQDMMLTFKGDNDSVIFSVLDGEYVAGAIRLDTLQRPLFTKIKDTLRVVYKSPKNPQFPFAVRADMDQTLRKEILKSLTAVSMEQPETATILKDFHLQGIEEINSDDMERLRKKRQREVK